MLQQKYGVNTSTNAGDTVYTLVAGNGPGTRYQAIWDVGGTDSIVYSGNSPVNIDLRAATLLTAPGGAGGLSYVGGTYGGFTIANGVVIEIATSGAGDDKLWGGAGNNILTAGAGQDTLSGGAGSDTLNGGDGDDRVLFEDNPAGVTVNLLLQTATDGWGNTDTLSSIEFVTGSAFNDYIVSGLGNSAGETNSQGGAGNDYIEDHASVWGGAFGGEGNDTLIMLGAGQAGFYGEGGDDVIIGGNADDYYLSGGVGNDTIRGGGGNDGITGGQGDDVLFGDAGNDEIDGFEGADVIFGGDGNDRLTGSYDADILTGGRGNDIIDGGAGFDTASFEETLLGVIVTLPTVYEGEASGAEVGVDVLIGIENVTGGAGADTLTGNQAPNILRGGGGSDLIDGGAGIDQLVGGAGNDTLEGGSGDDLLDGGSGIDTASYALAAAGVTVNLGLTSAQNTGAAGTDTLSGIENLTGSSFADVLTGDDQANLIRGGAGNDTLRGGSGADTIVLGSGQNQVYGDADDDTFLLTTVSFGLPDSTIDGGAGTDTLDYSVAASSLFFQTTNGSLPGIVTVGDNVVSNVEKFLGGSGGDIFSFVYFGRSVEVWGQGGDDQFSATSSADIFHGGEGNDRLDGGGGDSLFGDAGDDLFWVSGAFGAPPSSGVISGGAGVDTLQTNIQFVVDLAAGTAQSGSASFAVTSIERVQVAAWHGYQSTVRGGTTAETFSVNPLFNDGSVGVVFEGGGGSDTLLGSNGQDALLGDEGDDRLEGGAGADILSGGLGNDLLDGGEGADTASYAAAAAGVSVSLASTAAQNTLGDGIDTLTNIENVTGSAFDDTLLGNLQSNVIRGGGGSDLVYGGAGADQLLGEDGNDALYGGADGDTLSGGAGDDELQGETGNDRLFGGLGDDLIYGNEDNDTLYGEDGADVLLGGTGADIFAYASSSDGGDLIADFVGGSDSIMVRASGFGGGLAEGVAVTLRTGAAPSAIGTGGQFLYNTGSGALSWDADGVGAQAAVLIATLAGAPLLSASDIVVVSAVGAGPSSIGIGGPVDEPGPVLLDDPGRTARPDSEGLSAHGNRSVLAANHNVAPDQMRFQPYILTISQDGDEPVPTHPSPAPIFLSALALIEAAGADRDKRSMPVERDAPLEQANLASEAAAPIASPRLPSFEPGYATISPDSDQPLLGAMRQRAFLADDDHFVFAAADSMLPPDRVDPLGVRELRPHLFEAALLDDDATFDFSSMTAATLSDPAAGGGGQLVDFSWMDMADRPMPDLSGALPAFDSPAAVALDYRTPDMFEDGISLSLDGMAALGPDAFRIA